jgi:hypothetical protein
MRHRNPHTNRSGTGLLKAAWLAAAPALCFFTSTYVYLHT